MQDESIAPQFASLAVAARITGASRTKIYKLAPTLPGLLLKDGRTTLVNVAMLLARQRSLPPAQVGAKRQPQERA
jgi:hypothetical protein